jgi:ABC-type ATPase involved in cell division
MTVIINNMFRPQKTLKKTRLKLYSTLALTHLLYGSQNWVIKLRDTSKITAAEVKYMRKTAGYIWTDYKQTQQLQKN